MAVTHVDLPGGDWRKSSRSMNGGNCIEVASVGPTVLVRDSVNPSDPVVSYPDRAWRDFLTRAKAGGLDSTG
jgi:uncharacterized protein DUF397